VVSYKTSFLRVFFYLFLSLSSFQFLYQEQYDLVQQHQRLIASHTSGAQATGGAAPVDEEWGDEEEEEEESGDMVVDK